MAVGLCTQQILGLLGTTSNITGPLLAFVVKEAVKCLDDNGRNPGGSPRFFRELLERTFYDQMMRATPQKVPVILEIESGADRTAVRDAVMGALKYLRVVFPQIDFITTDGNDTPQNDTPQNGDFRIQISSSSREALVGIMGHENVLGAARAVSDGRGNVRYGKIDVVVVEAQDKEDLIRTMAHEIMHFFFQNPSGHTDALLEVVNSVLGTARKEAKQSLLAAVSMGCNVIGPNLIDREIWGALLEKVMTPWNATSGGDWLKGEYLLSDSDLVEYEDFLLKNDYSDPFEKLECENPAFKWVLLGLTILVSALCLYCCIVDSIRGACTSTDDDADLEAGKHPGPKPLGSVEALLTTGENTSGNPKIIITTPEEVTLWGRLLAQIVWTDTYPQPGGTVKHPDSLENAQLLENRVVSAK